ncbi:MAG: type II toxin-antitoxin system Phd/YefM family antitoxin [Solirubrobacteraceae bacterium]
MANVSIRELRNRGGDVIDRAARGEAITITKGGRPVAELRGLPASGLSAEGLISRWRRLPPMDPARLRADIDALVDQSL